MQYWGESCNACWWAGVPVVRRDPVDSYEPVDDGDLSEAYRVPGSRVAYALLPVAAGTGKVDRLAEACGDLGEVDEGLHEAGSAVERGPDAEGEVAAAAEVDLAHARRGG